MFLDWNSEGIGGIMQFGIPNAWRGFGGEGGGSALNFQRGKMAKAFLEITDRTTFPVCKSSSMHRPRKQDKD